MFNSNFYRKRTSYWGDSYKAYIISSLYSEMKVENLEGIIEELKMNQSKLELDLKNCKRTESDLVASRKETEELNAKLEAENFKYRNENVSYREKMLELKTNETKLASEIAGTKKFNKKLEDENRNYKIENVTNRELIFELKTNQTKLDSKIADYIQNEKRCVFQLKDVIKRKQVLQRKYELVCPWSEWSSCSKTCWGIKKRIEKCSNSDEQIKACNQDSSCPRSGK